jgi:hypothetical protein
VNTFLGNLELSALGNLDGLDWLVAGALGHVLDLVYDLVALKDLAEDDVAAIEPAGDNGGDEELRTVCILFHSQQKCGYSLAGTVPFRCWPC